MKSRDRMFGITKNELTNEYTVTYSKRHPVTRKPLSLKRIRNDKGLPITSFAEATRIRTQMVLQLESKFNKEIKEKKMNWKELVEKYMEHARETGDIQNVSLENALMCLKAHTFERWGDRPIESITPMEIRHLIKVELAGKAQSHQKNILKYIRAPFKYAVENRLILGSPVPELKFKVGRKLTTVLTRDEVRTFLQKAKKTNSEWYPLWTTAIYTGLRNGELYALKWENVDLEGRLIFVKEAWTNKTGFKNCTKNGGHRAVEIAPELLELLRELKKNSHDSVFVLPRLDKWDRGEQARELRMFLQATGLPRIRFHDLRAIWCTLMLNNGIEPIKVMRMAGWSEMKTMERYMRLAGIDIKGITDNFVLFNKHDNYPENVISLFKNGENQARSDLSLSSSSV